MVNAYYKSCFSKASFSSLKGVLLGALFFIQISFNLFKRPSIFPNINLESRLINTGFYLTMKCSR
jgi:hypothetical protein